MLQFFLVFAGDREGFLSYEDGIGVNLGHVVAVNQERTVNPHERIPKRRFPLRDAGLVTQFAPIGSMNKDLGISRLHIQNLTGQQRDPLTVRTECNRVLHLRMVTHEPSVNQRPSYGQT